MKITKKHSESIMRLPLRAGLPCENLTRVIKCSIVVFDENNIAKCSIESAYRKKKINFNKPISCHLYPIRVKKYDSFTAINIDSWHVCKPACQCGIELNVPVFRFLKDAIVRSWGLEFFNQLDLVHNEFFNEEKSK